jgi:hypothetical protein
MVATRKLCIMICDSQRQSLRNDRREGALDSSLWRAWPVLAAIAVLVTLAGCGQDAKTVSALHTGESHESQPAPQDARASGEDRTVPGEVKDLAQRLVPGNSQLEPLGDGTVTVAELERAMRVAADCTVEAVSRLGIRAIPSEIVIGPDGLPQQEIAYESGSRDITRELGDTAATESDRCAWTHYSLLQLVVSGASMTDERGVDVVSPELAKHGLLRS